MLINNVNINMEYFEKHRKFSNILIFYNQCILNTATLVGFATVKFLFRKRVVFVYRFWNIPNKQSIFLKHSQWSPKSIDHSKAGKNNSHVIRKTRGLRFCLQ